MIQSNNNFAFEAHLKSPLEPSMNNSKKAQGKISWAKNANLDI